MTMDQNQRQSLSSVRDANDNNGTKNGGLVKPQCFNRCGTKSSLNRALLIVVLLFGTAKGAMGRPVVNLKEIGGQPSVVRSLQVPTRRPTQRPNNRPTEAPTAAPTVTATVAATTRATAAATVGTTVAATLASTTASTTQATSNPVSAPTSFPGQPTTPSDNPAPAPTLSPVQATTPIPTAMPVTPDPTPSGTLEPTIYVPPTVDSSPSNGVLGGDSRNTAIIAASVVGVLALLCVGAICIFLCCLRSARNSNSSHKDEHTYEGDHTPPRRNSYNNTVNKYGDMQAEIVVPHQEEISTLGEPTFVSDGVILAALENGRKHAALENILEGQYEVVAPAGKLGMVITTPEGGMPEVHSIDDTSPVADRVQVGDKLISVDGEDCTELTAVAASKLISQNSEKHARVFIFAKPQEDQSSADI
eukprot:Nitzschia sp. Nitz4//scaffold235_size30605//21089//22425//NITZ4_007978-RA/size30605-augustus-gene-0.20-mRNA-1//-1//CDS//3329543462//8113//frame0